VIVYAVVDDALSDGLPLGLEVFIRREDAEQFIEEVRGDDPEWRRSSGSRSGSWRRAGEFALCAEESCPGRSIARAASVGWWL
jgi:hypothetical protein